MEQEQGRPSLPNLAKFERQFELKYGRQMSADERRWFELAEELLKNPPEEESSSNAAD
jgi:hypothetical protein